jgi:hypothetical protein
MSEESNVALAVRTDFESALRALAAQKTIARSGAARGLRQFV